MSPRTKRLSHHKVNSSELLDTALSRVFEAFELANVHGTDANDLSARAERRNLLRSALGLLYIATDNARISAQMDERADLGTADGTRTSSAEDHLVCCTRVSINVSGPVPSPLPKMPSFQMSLMYSDFGNGMVNGV